MLIKVENLSKKYSKNLHSSIRFGLNELFGRSSVELRKTEFWSNKGVNFDLKRGESLGIIGHNGAGKSTLLKMLAGLIKPTGGKITTNGSIAAIIELGAGFSPTLTGLENIQINARLLGISKQNLPSVTQEIIAFSGLEEFIHAPLSTYSSGMKVRLGFAIASCLRPDILIIDEVLAVGDANFRSKCYERIDELKKTSAIIFVSHNMDQVTRLCNRVLLLNKGSPAYIGDTAVAIRKYNDIISNSIPMKKCSHGNGKVINTSLSVNNDHGDSVSILETRNVRIQVKFTALENLDDVILTLSIVTISNEYVASSSLYQPEKELSFLKGEHSVEVLFDELQLASGTYRLGVLIQDRASRLIHYEWVPNLKEIVIEKKSVTNAHYQISGLWKVKY